MGEMIANIFAYKAFTCIARDTPQIRLCGYMRTEYQYNLFDVNVTPLNPGFYSFVSLPELMKQDGAYMRYMTTVSYANGNPRYFEAPLIGVIQLSGEVVRAQRGYRSSEFQILGLYTPQGVNNKDRRGLAHRLGYPKIDKFENIPRMRNVHVAQV